MAEKNNATCSICGKEYHVCLSCRDSINLAPWKLHTDTSEHYKIYQIILGYNTKVYTKEETIAKLKNVDLSDLDSFREHIKVLIKDILNEDVETISKAEVEVKAKTEEIIEVEKLKSTRKKYSKVETE